MKRLLNIFCVLFVSGYSFAQTVPSPNENYIFSTTYLTADKSKKTETIQYLDGLGRPKQIIDVKGAVSGKDLVVPIEYDDFGRQVTSYLPLPVNSLNGSFQPVEGADVNSYYEVSNAYSESVLEDSPLNRLRQSAFPGDEWAKNEHTVKYDYDTNTTLKDGAIKQFITTTFWQDNIVHTTFTVSSYPDFQLYKTIIKDEDNNETHLFKNKKGQTVLVRKVVNATQNADTYYVYNKYNHLAYIIPPLASAKPSLLQDDLDELCYQYRYDEKGRVAEKKLPGKGLDPDTGTWYWDLMVYDNQDRLVMSQDANLWKQGQWLFTKYDKFGRTAYTGMTSTTDSRSSIQTILNTKGSNNVARTSSSGFTAPGLLVYYDNLPANNYPNSFTTILSVNYYDTYPSGSPSVPTEIFNQEVLTQDSQNSIISTKSLPTASFVKNIDNTAWTKTYIWYDTKARPIVSHTINHLGGYTKTETKLDFVGVPEKTFTYHKRKSAGEEIEIQEHFEYDDRKRLIKHEHEVIGKSPKEVLAEYTYNDREQLVEKRVGSSVIPTTGGISDPMQTVSYSYNIRGWLTGINMDELGNPVYDKLFNYKIKYTDPENESLAPKRYNGSIAEIDWWNDGSTAKRYGYQYDQMNRLLNGIYQDPDRTVPLTYINSESIEYDLNGNITRLYRNAKHQTLYTPIQIDNLTYHYVNGNGKSNRLESISDAANNFSGYEGGGGTIEYDANGNMTVMPDKGISEITYNFLNLPTQILQNDNTLKYSYRADGAKIKKVFTLVNDEGTTIVNTEYLDGFQYSTPNTEPIRRALEVQDDITVSAVTAGEEEAFESLQERLVIADPGNPQPDDLILSFFPTAEGYYDYENLRYIYQYKDQVGNIRISYVKENDQLKIMSTNEYYPFGMSFLKPNARTVYDPLAIPYNYKFGEKELQETGMYDFGARMYMPDIGRWSASDPLAELRPDMTPFRYGFNNPISFTDPTGMYEDSGMDDSDRGDFDRGNDNDRLIYFGWSEEARNTDADNAFDKTILTILDIINLDFFIGSDIRSGGDGSDSFGDFGQDMGQENGSNDMMYDAVQDSNPNQNGPGPRKPMTPEEFRKQQIRERPWMSDGPVNMMGGPGDPFGIFEALGMVLANSDSNAKYAALPLLVVKGKGKEALKVLATAKGGSKLLKFPGNNPAKAPKGFEWKGKPGSTPGSKDGNWYNPKTGESLRPDLNHPNPIGPHWDYKDPSGKWWRIFPNGSNVPK